MGTAHGRTKEKFHSTQKTPWALGRTQQLQCAGGETHLLNPERKLGSPPYVHCDPRTAKLNQQHGFVVAHAGCISLPLHVWGRGSLRAVRLFDC